MTTTRTIDIVAALEDGALFGGLPAFRDLTSWRPWLVFLRAFYGLPIEGDDLETFRSHTGRREPRPGGYHEVVAIVGRQSGKTRIAALTGVFEAARAVMEGESGVYIPLIAQDLRGATRALFAYVTEAIDASEALSREVTRRTTTEIELAGRVTIGVYPCRPASVRGIRAAHAAVDELAFFISTDGRPTDTEMLRAVRPSLATTGGRLLILSSPYAQTGALWELHRRHYGRDGSNVLVWQATAPEMNPTLPVDYLERMEADDPEAWRSEVLGEFRAGISELFAPEAITACVATDVRERLPEPGRSYIAFADPSSGSGKDAFSVAIAHAEGVGRGEERGVLDVVRAWRPPFNPSGVIAEASELLKRFGLREVSGDRYAPGFVDEGFRGHGVTYRPSERNRSELYLELLPAVNAASVVLLDDAETLRELRGLERRRGTQGRDRVDHRPGAHDDRANSAAGALVAALEAVPSRRGAGLWWRDVITGEEFRSGWFQDDETGTWLEYQNNLAWNGIALPDKDSKGQYLSRWASRLEQGAVVEYLDVTKLRKGE